MDTITGEAVWEVVQRDLASRKKNGMDFSAAIEPFVMAVPTVLGNLLQEKVSVKSIAESRLKVLRYLQDKQFTTAIISWLTIGHLPPESFGLLGPDRLLRLLNEDIQAEVDVMMTVNMDVLVFLSLHQMSEHEALWSFFGLSSAILERLGELTIGELLLSEPETIIWFLR